jgi:hypothetical protein
MCFCRSGGWRVGIRVGDLGNRTFVVANGEEFAKLSLARRNNPTIIISIMILVRIDVQEEALSHEYNGIIDIPEFIPF